MKKSVSGSQLEFVLQNLLLVFAIVKSSCDYNWTLECEPLLIKCLMK
jgi:hypothetical protein